MLILTEKESVAQNYALALNLKKTKNNLYENENHTLKVTYAAGHLYTLYDMADYETELLNWTNVKKLPYIPKEFKTKADDGFKKAKKNIRTCVEENLRKAIRDGEEIVIATDPDREGEVIARFILEKIGIDISKTSRLWCCEGINRNEVVKSIKERKPSSEYDKLYEKGKAQKCSDWVLGLNITRLLTLILKTGEVWSIGRVQTAVMQQLYDREMSIRLFIPKDYYELKVTCKDGSVFYVDSRTNNNTLITDRKYLENIEEKVKQSNKIEIFNSKKTEEKKRPPRLYDSAELGADSYNLFGYDVDKTLAISQSLYNEEGCISYPRTSSRYLKEEDADSYIQKYNQLLSVLNLKNKGYVLLSDNKNVFDTKKCIGHHAIVPDGVYKKNDEEKKNVYNLVLERFIMQGMGEEIIIKTECDGYSNGVSLKSKGSKIENEGWHLLDRHKEKETDKLDCYDGEIKEVAKTEILSKKTEPEKYYNQATLIAWMKNPGGKDDNGNQIIGIGTQATQANIIRTLFDRKYIVTKGKHIEITEKGIRLIEEVRSIPILDENTRVEATTRWELMNEENPKQFLEEIEEVTRKIFIKMGDKLNTAVKKKKAGICPACGGDIIGGKSGWYCSNYKDKNCTNALSYKIMGNDITEEVIAKIINEGKTELMKGVKKDGSDCEFMIKKDDKGMFTLVFSENNEPICNCPKCSKPVFAYAKVFKCSNTSCDFFLWRKTSGMDITKDIAKQLCEGKSVKNIQHKKDGSTANVYIKLNDDFSILNITYKNS